MSGYADVPAMILNGRNCSLVMDRPYIVGILNVTPDSFSDGGHFLELQQALAQGRKMAEEGADLIDVGGESTRPGAAPVSEQEELDRVVPVIEALGRELGLPLSVDTTKSAVAREAVAAGAAFINDVSGLMFDDEMAGVVAESDAGVIVMHTRGRPAVMQQDTRYDDLVPEVLAGLRRSLDAATAAGIDSHKTAIDPGIGFGKDVAGNLELLRRISELLVLDRPILVGTSRKSFMGAVLAKESPSDRLGGALVTIALAYAGGARLFRVHDVAASRQAALMAQAVCKGAAWTGN